MKDINLPPFYISQRVVCVKSSNWIKEGNIYFVKGLFFLSCCKIWMINVGVANTINGKRYCQKHNKHYNAGNDKFIEHNANKFVPIEENFQSISLEKVLENETNLISVN